jgi:GT2 family glycosyltransferase
MKVSLIIVCHHSSEVLPACVESFRRQAANVGGAEVVAVDHSEDPEEARRIASADVDVVIERTNRGYAAGLNAGMAAASGDVLLLANPDIRFFDGSLEALFGGLDAGFDIVGPQFVWDADATVLLPPAEDPAPVSELGRSLQRRWRWLWSSGLQRRLQGTLQAWTANSVLPAASLRGALMALRREVADRYGPFDEGYFLYHEETEWLWRARGQGARLGLVAPARVQHQWGHATRLVDGIVEREAGSRERFYHRNHPAIWRWLLRLSADRGQTPTLPVRQIAETGEIPEIEADLWLASPFSHLMPALGCIRTTGFPRAFLEFCRDQRWFVTAAKSENGRWRLLDPLGREQ